MPRLTLKVEGLRDAVSLLDDVGERARRPEPALRADNTLLDLLEGEQRKFNRGGWRRNTPRWTQEKRRRGLDPRVARATGHLERALTNESLARAEITFRAYNAVLHWGIPGGRHDLYRAKAIAKARHGRRGIKVVVLDKQTKVRIVRRVQEYIASGSTV